MAEERRNHAARKRFDQAVERAAEQAAQKVARIHRRRLVTQSFFAAMGVTLLVLVLLWFTVFRPLVVANAVYDCGLFTQASGLMGNFAASDAELRQRLDLQPGGRARLAIEVIADLQKIIRPATLHRLLAGQRAAEQVTLTNWRKDATRLDHLAGANCRSHLGG